MPNVEAQLIDTWFQNETEEAGMFEDHAYLWRHMISLTPDENLSSTDVLDYGCNRGGFLRTLFKERPFRFGVGADVAQTSLAFARQLSAGLPLSFQTPDTLQLEEGRFGLAFSHEVLYVLEDLATHAKLIKKTLAPGASYYASIGCHTGNPLWPRWRALIAETTNLPVFDYSLDDYARAFWSAGFSVEMREFSYPDFVLIKPQNAYFPKVADSLHYHSKIKTLIRVRKVS